MKRYNAEVIVKKYLPYIIGIVVILGSIGVYIALQGQNHTSNPPADSSDSSKETASAKKYTNACKLFTKQDLNDTLGGTFGDGEEDIAFSTATPGTPDYDNEDLQGSACKFDQEDDGTTASMQQSIRLSVEIKTFASVDKATTWTNELHSPPTAEGQEAMDKPVDVQGMGDQAFFAKVNTGGAGSAEDKNESLYIRSGRQVIVLTVTRLAGIDHDAMQASLTKLAKKL